jgi:hypothetical protein
MLVQAAGFALLAAISPTALLVLAVFLGSDNPRVTAFFYLTGALVMSAVMAVAVLLVIRSTGLNLERQHGPRSGLRLGIGILALAAAAYVARRAPRPPDPAQPGRGFMSALVARPAPATAFLAGIVLFAPSITFIAAVQVIATAQAAVTVTATAVVVVVAISALFVWLPLIAYLVFPDATSSLLRRLNGWLRANGRVLIVAALAVGGLALVINGALGLAR